MRRHPLTTVAAGFTGGLLMSLSPGSKKTAASLANWAFRGGLGFARMAAAALHNARAPHRAHKEAEEAVDHAQKAADAAKEAEAVQDMTSDQPAATTAVHL
jgi:hypothetical protein